MAYVIEKLAVLSQCCELYIASMEETSSLKHLRLLLKSTYVRWLPLWPSRDRTLVTFARKHYPVFYVTCTEIARSFPCYANIPILFSYT